MRRRTFDTLLSLAGAVVTVLLLTAGGLLTWASTFVADQVHDQLAAQQIYFPEAGEQTADPRIGPFVEQYAGQQLTTGAQAKAYADHYIAVHIEDMTGGRTYSQLSTESRANPDDTALADLVQTTFRGETLRGLLLNAYAFGQMGLIASWAAIVSFVGAGLLALLTVLGFVHRARTAESVELLLGSRTEAPVEM